MRRWKPPGWIGYLAAGLILGHAALSYYWAAGGTAGFWLLADGIQELGRERSTDFVLLVWGIAVLKTLIGLVSLSFAAKRRLPLPRWLLLLIVWGTGVVLTFYGTLMIVLLAFTGPLLSDTEPESGYWAYLLLWAPLWLAIGIAHLLLAARITFFSETTENEISQ